MVRNPCRCLHPALGPCSREPLDARTTYLSRAYFPALDGLRALSITPVVLYHATPRPLEGALGRGPLGVDLFFALSGFLITTLLLRERRDAGEISLSRFYARRSLRIFPAYYVVLLGYAAYAVTLSDTSPVRAHFFASLPFFATYTTNWLIDFAVPHAVLFSYAWSLAAEEQFYAFFPGVIALASRVIGRAHLPAALAMAALLVWDALAEKELFFASGTVAERVATSFPAPIGLGCLVALALDHPRTFALLAGLLAHPAMRLVLAAVAAMAFLVGIPIALAWIAFALWIGAMALPHRGLDDRLLASAPLRALGRISYSLYLTHVAAIGIVRRLFPERVESTGFVFLLAFPLAILVATALHLSVERPLLRLKDRWRASGGHPQKRSGALTEESA